MGSCTSRNQKSRTQISENETTITNFKRNQIAPPVLKEKRNQLLLFGIGEAGKTTIARQLSLANGKSLHNSVARSLLYENVFEGLALALKLGEKKYEMDFTQNEDAILVRKEYEKLKQSAGHLNLYYIPKSVAVAFKNLMQSSDVQKCLENKHLIQISDGWDFLADQLMNGYPEWGGPSHIVSNDDMLHSRIRSTGKHSENFEHDGVKYKLIDLGGQRVERRRIYDGFKHVDAILYVVSMSDYDQKLFEDNTMFRLNETVELWSKIVNNKNFSNTVFILIFNKSDLLYKKFKQRGVRIRSEHCLRAHEKPPLPEDEDENCSKVKYWFEDLFKNQVKDENKRSNDIRTYFTNALNKNDIGTVLQFIPSFLTHNQFRRKSS